MALATAEGGKWLCACDGHRTMTGVPPASVALCGVGELFGESPPPSPPSAPLLLPPAAASGKSRPTGRRWLYTPDVGDFGTLLLRMVGLSIHPLEPLEGDVANELAAIEKPAPPLLFCHAR